MFFNISFLAELQSETKTILWKTGITVESISLLHNWAKFFFKNITQHDLWYSTFLAIIVHKAFYRGIASLRKCVATGPCYSFSLWLFSHSFLSVPQNIQIPFNMLCSSYFEIFLSLIVPFSTSELFKICMIYSWCSIIIATKRTIMRGKSIFFANQICNFRIFVFKHVF